MGKNGPVLFLCDSVKLLASGSAACNQSETVPSILTNDNAALKQNLLHHWRNSPPQWHAATGAISSL